MCVGVFLALTVSGWKIVILEMLNPPGQSFHILVTKKPGQAGVVGTQVKFLAVEVFVVFHCLHISP
jgi:hypothetical protein